MRVRSAAAALLLLASVAADPAHARRLQVCAFSFNAPEEVDAFKEHLSSEDFEIVDLSPALMPAALPGAPLASRPTLSELCRPDLRCDVVVYSAEFAGRFFGRCGQSLGLEEMEEASCKPRCDGLFHTPSEVFLLACNTLATKDLDQRTPEQYLQVLLDHGFERGEAERVVALRYGPLGPTFREALRRIFMGVPRIYGFSSVAPQGVYTGPMLDRYFHAVGDYRRHLEEAGRSTSRNAELLHSFAGTSLVQTPGLMPGEAATVDRDLICALYDEQEPVARRLAIVRDLLERENRLAFVPSIQVFVDRHSGDTLQGDEKRLFDEIRANAAARASVLEVARELDVSALQLELAHFAVHMGWMSREEMRGLALNAARELLHRPLSSEVVDVMCELPKHESVGDAFESKDLPMQLFWDPEGIRLISCLGPRGEQVSVRLVPVLESPDEPTRQWAAHALTRRVPLSDTVLAQIAHHLNDPAPAVRERLRWIFRAAAPLSPAVRRAVAATDPTLLDEIDSRARRGS